MPDVFRRGVVQEAGDVVEPFAFLWPLSRRASARWSLTLRGMGSPGTWWLPALQSGEEIELHPLAEPLRRM